MARAVRESVGALHLTIEREVEEEAEPAGFMDWLVEVTTPRGGQKRDGFLGAVNQGLRRMLAGGEKHVAAAAIGAHWRGYRTRLLVATWVWAAMEMQRHARGKHGRAVATNVFWCVTHERAAAQEAAEHAAFEKRVSELVAEKLQARERAAAAEAEGRRFVTVTLPVGYGEQFQWTVDGARVTFHAPLDKVPLALAAPRPAGHPSRCLPRLPLHCSTQLLPPSRAAGGREARVLVRAEGEGARQPDRQDQALALVHRLQEAPPVCARPRLEPLRLFQRLRAAHAAAFVARRAAYAAQGAAHRAGEAVGAPLALVDAAEHAAHREGQGQAARAQHLSARAPAGISRWGATERTRAVARAALHCISFASSGWARCPLLHMRVLRV